MHGEVACGEGTWWVWLGHIKVLFVENGIIHSKSHLCPMIFVVYSHYCNQGIEHLYQLPKLLFHSFIIRVLQLSITMTSTHTIFQTVANEQRRMKPAAWHSLHLEWGSAHHPRCYICGLFYLWFHRSDFMIWMTCNDFYPFTCWMASLLFPLWAYYKQNSCGYSWMPLCADTCSLYLLKCLQMGFLGHIECVFFTIRVTQLFTKYLHHFATSTIWAFWLFLILTALLSGFFSVFYLFVFNFGSFSGYRICYCLNVNGPHRFRCLNT